MTGAKFRSDYEPQNDTPDFGLIGWPRSVERTYDSVGL